MLTLGPTRNLRGSVSTGNPKRSLPYTNTKLTSGGNSHGCEKVISPIQPKNMIQLHANSKCFGGYQTCLYIV